MSELSVGFDLYKLMRMKLKWVLQTCMKDLEWHSFKFKFAALTSTSSSFHCGCHYGTCTFLKHFMSWYGVVISNKSCMLDVVCAMLLMFFFVNKSCLLFVVSYMVFKVCCC